jgi:ubiquinone/menaquinone biosynthesis C-methylase UbiE
MTTNDWGIPGSTVEIYHNIYIPATIGEWVPRVMALVDPKPGEKVLDVASGSGALTSAIPEKVGRNGSVTGVDLSPEMLNLAQKLTDGRLPAIEWRECDAQYLPFDDEIFDVAFCQLGLMFIPDKAAALKEMFYVLKPGGRLGVMVWGAIEMCPGQMALAKTWGKLFGADQAAGFYRMHSMSDPETLRSLFEVAGFQEINIQLMMGTLRLPSVEHCVSSYGALGRFPADLATQAAAIREVAQALQDYEGSDGLVYPIEAVLGKGIKP